MTAQQIIRTLTPLRVAVRLGVSPQAVYNVKALFPARWYPHILALCAEDGIECPMDAFRFSRQTGEGKTN